MREGNIQIVQLLDAPPPDIRTGQADPIQGWVSPGYGERVPAPVVSWRQRSKKAHFVTLLLPHESDAPFAGLRGMETDGNTLDIRFGAYGREYRITLGEESAEVSVDPS